MTLGQTTTDSTQPNSFSEQARTVLLDVREGLYRFRQVLHARMGEAEADLMFDMGLQMGRAIVRNILADNEAQPGADTFRAAVGAYTRAGAGDLQVEELEWEGAGAELICPDTFEGWAYAQNNDLRLEGKCDYSRGVLAALMIETHRAAKLEPEDIYCVERTCLGRGDDECCFIIGRSADLKAAGLSKPKPRPSVHDQLEELLVTAQRRAVQLEVGREVAMRLMAALNPDELMAQIVQLVQNYFGYYHVHIYLLDSETGLLNMMEGTGEPGRIMKDSGHNIALGQGLVGKVAQTGKPMLVADVSREPQWLPNPLLPETRAELTVPLRLGGEILGVLDVQSNSVGGVTEEDLSLLEGLGGQIAITIQNARLFDSERRRRLEAITLQKVSHSLSLSLDLDEILDVLLQQLQKVLSFNSAAIFLRDQDTLRPVAGAGRSVQEKDIRRDFTTVIPLENFPLAREIVETKEPLVLFDAPKDERFRPLEGMDDARCWIGVPLIVQDEVIGILTVAGSQPGAYDEETAQTVLAFASQAAIAFQNATLFAELETHRAKLEDQVAERTRELRWFQTFAETAPNVILMGDLEDKVRYANPAFYELFGYDAASKDAEGLHISKFIGRSERNDKIEAAGSHRAEMMLLRQDGSAFLADVITFLVEDEAGAPTVRAYIIRDISAEKQLQHEQALLREDLIKTQQRLIEELSTPIIPVTDDILVLPLIGSIDSPRAQRIIEALLEGLEDYQARIVILDITGVPNVDSDVANYLMQAAMASRLLGTEAVLVGITPQVAQAFVDLDIELTGVVTRGNLQSGIEYALNQMGLHIAKSRGEYRTSPSK